MSIAHIRESLYYRESNYYWMKLFVASRIIKVKVEVKSQSQRLRLITLAEALIILNITRTESNNCFNYTLISKIHFALLANQKRDSEFNVGILQGQNMSVHKEWTDRITD